MVDYSGLDHWCGLPTWYTGHSMDLQRRREALERVIDLPGFDPADAAAYVADNHADGIWPGKEGEMRKAITEFEAMAKRSHAKRSGR